MSRSFGMPGNSAKLDWRMAMRLSIMYCTLLSICSASAASRSSDIDTPSCKIERNRSNTPVRLLVAKRRWASSRSKGRRECGGNRRGHTIDNFRLQVGENLPSFLHEFNSNLHRVVSGFVEQEQDDLEGEQGANDLLIREMCYESYGRQAHRLQ